MPDIKDEPLIQKLTPLTFQPYVSSTSLWRAEGVVGEIVCRLTTGAEMETESGCPIAELGTV